MARIGPVVLEVPGDTYAAGCQIGEVIWEGETQAGDRVELRHTQTQALLWPGRTDRTQTYLGANFGPYGLHCPGGFTAPVLDSGRVLVYLLEKL